MTIREKIKASSLELAGHVTVTDVRIGLVYTAVRLDNGQVGVAYTFHRDLSGGCPALKGCRSLAGSRASELISLLDARDKISSAVGLATVNALTNTWAQDLVKGDVLDHLNIHSHDTVGMVGHFAPMVPALKKRVSVLKVFEQIDQPKGGLLPEKEAFQYLPHCHVALITSTSILNHTIDALLDAARSCREVVLLGASTPLVSEAFAGTSVTALSGVIASEPEEILRIVSEGGGMRHFKGHISKVNCFFARP